VAPATSVNHQKVLSSALSRCWKPVASTRAGGRRRPAPCPATLCTREINSPRPFDSPCRRKCALMYLPPIVIRIMNTGAIEKIAE